jgi:WhiB family redox-sensing transcriptional regulator
MVVTQLPTQRAALEEERRDWWRLAACREMDPELFFPVGARGPGAGEIDRAKAVCAGCRVRRQCLQYALATHQMHGVWGGTTEEERQVQVRQEREVAQRQQRRKVVRPAHGEPSGNDGRTRSTRIRSV